MTAYRNVDSEWTLEMKPLIRRQPNSALLQAKCQVILQLDHTRLKLAVSDAMLKSKDCAPFGSKLQLRPGSFDNFIGSDVSARTSFNQGPRGHFVPTDLFQFGSGYALERTMVLHLLDALDKMIINYAETSKNPKAVAELKDDAISRARDKIYQSPPAFSIISGRDIWLRGFLLKKGDPKEIAGASVYKHSSFRAYGQLPRIQPCLMRQPF
jgi:hypothetical protein